MFVYKNVIIGRLQGMNKQVLILGMARLINTKTLPINNILTFCVL